VHPPAPTLQACIKELDSASTQGGALDAACAKLEKLLQGLRLPDSLLQQVRVAAAV
jgi:hypothetical protein